MHIFVQILISLTVQDKSSTRYGLVIKININSNQENVKIEFNLYAN